MNNLSELLIKADAIVAMDFQMKLKPVWDNRTRSYYKLYQYLIL